MTQVIFDRSCGILLHISSLPSPHGVGDIRQAINFIDFLVSAGQSYWQILPVNPTSPIFGNSPYMSFSAYAGNPLLIDPEDLFERGLLMKEDLTGPGFSPYFVEYDEVSSWKYLLLQKAWKQFQLKEDKSQFTQFCEETIWLDQHGLFMALKDRFDQRPWYECQMT